MSVILEDRPIDKVREEVIDQLIFNYSHGEISSEAFERRLDSAMASQSHQEIVHLVADLQLKADASYNNQKDTQFNIKYGQDRPEESDTIINIFGGANLGGQWSVPKVIRIISVFGGSEIDFTDAIFHTPQVTVKILCIFGGEEIYVQENIKVVSKAFCVFGGIDNKAPSIANRQAPTIILEGLVLFGGVDIGIKLTIKEKFVAFANKLKTMIDPHYQGK